MAAVFIGPFVSWFSVKMTAVDVALRRTQTSPIAAVMVPAGSGVSS